MRQAPVSALYGRIRPIQIREGHAAIPVGDADGLPLFALIDLDDVELVDGVNWHLSKAGYARTQLPAWRRPERGMLLLHRYLTCALPNERVAFVNRDRLDCRRSNLRVSLVLTPEQREARRQARLAEQRANAALLRPDDTNGYVFGATPPPETAEQRALRKEQVKRYAAIMRGA